MRVNNTLGRWVSLALLLCASPLFGTPAGADEIVPGEPLPEVSASRYDWIALKTHYEAAMRFVPSFDRLRHDTATLTARRIQTVERLELFIAAYPELDRYPARQRSFLGNALTALQECLVALGRGAEFDAVRVRVRGAAPAATGSASEVARVAPASIPNLYPVARLRELIEAGHDEAAVELSAAADTGAPAELWFLRAQALFKLGRYREMTDTLDRLAVTGDDTWCAPYTDYYRAIALAREGNDPAAAEERLRRIPLDDTGLPPDFRNLVRFELGERLIARGDTAAALAEYERVDTGDSALGRAALYNRIACRAALAVETGLPELVAEYQDRFGAADETGAAAMLRLLADWRLARGDTAAALDDYRRLAALLPAGAERAEARRAVALLLMSAGEFDAALAEFGSAEGGAAEAPAELWFLRAQSLFNKGEYRAMAEALERLAATGAEEKFAPYPDYYRAVCYAREMNDLAAAEARLRRISLDDPGLDPDFVNLVRFELGGCLLARGETAAALAEFDRITTTERTLGRAVLYNRIAGRAGLTGETGLPELVAEYRERYGTEDETGVTEFIRLLADWRLRQGDTAAAIGAFREFAARLPDGAELAATRLTIVSLLMNSGEYAAAIAELAILEAGWERGAFPTDTPARIAAWRLKFEAHYELADYPAALAVALAAPAAGTDDGWAPDAAGAVAGRFLERDEWRAAGDAALRCVERFPDRAYLPGLAARIVDQAFASGDPGYGETFIVALPAGSPAAAAAAERFCGQLLERGEILKAARALDTLGPDNEQLAAAWREAAARRLQELLAGDGYPAAAEFYRECVAVRPGAIGLDTAWRAIILDRVRELAAADSPLAVPELAGAALELYEPGASERTELDYYRVVARESDTGFGSAAESFLAASPPPEYAADLTVRLASWYDRTGDYGRALARYQAIVADTAGRDTAVWFPTAIRYAQLLAVEKHQYDTAALICGIIIARFDRMSDTGERDALNEPFARFLAAGCYKELRDRTKMRNQIQILKRLFPLSRWTAEAIKLDPARTSPSSRPRQ